MKKLLFFLLLGVFFAGNTASNPELLKKNAMACTACHGDKGISVNPDWPNLAGQHARYLLKQLNDLQKGHDRQSVVMVQPLSTLTPPELEDLAVYYAAFPTAAGVTPEKYLKRGERLYRGGDFDKHITACIACHGPKGTGNAQAGFPLLSGQHAAYTILQLQAFKENKRSNDLNSIMRDISARMSTSDIEAVANYIAGLY